MKVSIGERFTRLIVIAPAENKWNNKRCRVRCDCGTEKTVVVRALIDGKVKSCKCLDREKRIERNTKHGLAKRGLKHPLYAMWQGMIGRCTNPNNNAWFYYGGQGITVCERWHNFADFLVDMGPRPSPKHEIDRIDCAGNYEPANCRWLTAADNRRNQRPRRWHKRPVEVNS